MHKLIQYNNKNYNIHIITLPVSFSIKISCKNTYCIVIYIPHENKNFTYNIVSADGKLQTEEIEGVLQIFTNNLFDMYKHLLKGN